MRSRVTDGGVARARGLRWSVTTASMLCALGNHIGGVASREVSVFEFQSFHTEYCRAELALYSAKWRVPVTCSHPFSPQIC